MEISKIKDNYVFRKFNNIFLLIPLHSSPMDIIKLNALGALFWKLIEQGLDEESIIKVTSKEFNKPARFIRDKFDKFKKVLEANSTPSKGILMETKIDNTALIRRATLELTGKCNLNCFHCYAKGKRNLKDMSTKKILSLLDEMVENDTLFLSLTGGEIFSRKDFPVIYEKIRLKGLIPSMISNGTLLNDEIFDILVKYPPAHIKFSLYGSEAKTHEFVTRIRGSFDKTIKAIKRLNKAGTQLFVGSTLFKETASDMDNIKKLCDKIGIHVAFASSLIPTHEKDKSFFDHEADLNIAKKVHEHNLSVKDKFIGGQKPPEKRSKGMVYDCISGDVNYSITSDGYLVICIHDINKEIDLTKIFLKEGLIKLKEIRKKRLRIPDGCKKCPLIYNLHCN